MEASDVQKLLDKLQSPNEYSRRVLVIRHGHSEGNAKSEMYGSTDYPLNPLGIKQAQYMRKILEKYIDQVSEIRTSNLTRSLQTCKWSVDLDRNDIVPQMEVLKVKPSRNNWALQQDFDIFTPKGRFTKSQDFQLVKSIKLSPEEEATNGKSQTETAQTTTTSSSSKEPRSFKSEGIKFSIDQRLQEFGLGIMENMEFNSDKPTEELSRAYVLIMKGVLKPFGGDSAQGFRNRIYSSINDLEKGVSLVFGHSGIVRMLLELFNETQSYVHNCGFLMIDFDDLEKGASLRGIFRGLC